MLWVGGPQRSRVRKVGESGSSRGRREDELTGRTDQRDAVPRNPK